MAKIKDLNVQIVKNPFKVESDNILPIQCNNEETLLDIRKKYFPEDIECVVARNGEVIPTEELYLHYPVPGDYIIIAPEIVGGGDGKGGMLGALAMIVVGIAAPYALAALGIGTMTASGFAVAGSTLLGSLAVGGVMVGAGLLMNALLPPPKPHIPEIPSFGSFDTSNAYSWDPKVTQVAGIPIMRVYGKHKIESANIITVNTYRQMVDDGSGILASKQFANILYCLGLGPYAQISNIKINNQPTESYGNTIWVSKRLGSVTQTAISGFNDTAIEYPQSVKLQYNSPYIYTSIGSEFDKFEVDILFPRGVYYMKDDGDLEVVTVSVKFEARAPDIGINDWVHIATYDCTTSHTHPIHHTFYIKDFPHARVEIRLSKLTPDHNDLRWGDEVYFVAFREIYYDDFSYPRQVLVGVQGIPIEQLGGSAQLTCDVEGAYIRVYKPGVGWSVECSDNPAWIAYDMLTKPVLNSQYNVIKYRGFDPSRLKLDEWIALAEYCDELVPDGKGGYEKRCTFNGIFDYATSTWSAVLQVLQVARAVPVWDGVKIGVVIDKKIGNTDLDGITQIFGMGNIIKGTFREIFSSVSERASILQADYLDAENDYKRITLTRTRKNIGSGNVMRIPLQGATKMSQVWRELEFRLEKNEKLVNICQIDVGVEALRCTIGDKVGVSHDAPRWGFSGRISSATINSVTIDREVTIESGKSYVIMVQHRNDNIEVKTIANAPGTYTTLNLASPFSAVPDQYCNYTFGENIRYIKPFKVIGITPHEDIKKRTLTLLEYNGSIYNVDYNLPTIPTLNYSAPVPMQPVSQLQLKERFYKVGNNFLSGIEIYFSRPPNNYDYYHAEIWMKSSKTNTWQFKGSTPADFFLLEGVSEGYTYTIKVVAVYAGGLKYSFSSSPEASIYIFGKSAPPSDVSTIWAQASIGGLRLDWTAVTDIDLDSYQIRWTSNTNGTWENASIVAQKVYVTTCTIPAAKDGMYLVKAIDVFGNWSRNAARVITNIPSILTWHDVATLIEHPQFTGTKTNMYIEHNLLWLSGTGLFDSDEMFDGDEDFDYSGGVASEGFYETSAINFGSVQTARCSYDVDFIGYNVTGMFDGDGMFDADEMFDEVVDKVGVVAQVALSEDGVNFGDWQNFFVGDYTGQKIKFRVKAYTESQEQYLAISSLEFKVDMPDRAESAEDVVCPAQGLNITYSRPFMALPRLACTIQNAQPGDTPVWANQTLSGCTLKIMNGSQGVQRVVDWEAKRY